LALDSVVALNGTALVLDASCARVQAGLVGAGREPAWIATDDEAGVGLFRAAAALLDEAGLKPLTVGAYVFCDGPGSQLGIRTAAMAIRTWQALRAQPAPVFTYRSLRLAAHGLAGSPRSPDLSLSNGPSADSESAGVAPPFAVVCDARRESWHIARVASGGAVGLVKRVPADEPAALGMPLFQPEGFRTWAEPPAPVATCDYTCAALFARLASTELLEPAANAEPWNPAPPDYKKWSGERHRAPSPSADPR
jgi:tRNA threonylcarbamoyladenosine biosynthesis protein TsaB